MGGIRTGLRGAYGAECHSHFELESRCVDDPHQRGESATSPRDFGVINGIQKTVAVEVVHTKADDDDGRRTSHGSSQRELGPCVSVESDST
ncbi:Minor extracellular protease vpr [Apiospora arundinis]